MSINDVPFTLQDVIECIRNGDDSLINSVVVTLDGEVQLITLNEAQQNADNYAVRHETFDAENDYVGIEASEDQEHVEGTYSRLVKAWHKHIKTGRTSVYADGF